MAHSLRTNARSIVYILSNNANSDSLLKYNSLKKTKGNIESV